MVPQRAFTAFNHNVQNRYFRNLRRHAYTVALQSIEAKLPDIKGHVQLTGLTPAVHAAMEQQWMPLIDEDNLSDPQRYRAEIFENFVTYRQLAGKPVLDEMPYSWAPHRFELAVWGDGQLCGLALTTVRERHDDKGVMAVGVVVGPPFYEHPLRGRLGPIVQFAALAWAAELGRNEVHYLGSFSPSGERMMQRVVANHGFMPEPRGDGEYADTMRFSVAKNLPLLKPA